MGPYEVSFLFFTWDLIEMKLPEEKQKQDNIPLPPSPWSPKNLDF